MSVALFVLGVVVLAVTARLSYLAGLRRGARIGAEEGVRYGWQIGHPVAGGPVRAGQMVCRGEDGRHYPCEDATHLPVGIVLNHAAKGEPIRYVARGQL